MINKNKKKKRVFVAGHNGLAGSAIKNRLGNRKDVELVVCEKNTLDLTQPDTTYDFFAQHAIDEIYLAAAKVGGIFANDKFPADFIHQNLMISCSVINAAHQANVNKLLYLGSSCIYPKHAKQPIDESLLLSGPLEPTNDAYAVAKIAGIKLCESYNRQFGRDYRCVMPCNLYGPNDNFHYQNSHVVPALLRRFHEAKLNCSPTIVVFGSGKPRREFLFVEDFADACIFLMEKSRSHYYAQTNHQSCHINIGTGQDCTIEELAVSIAKVVGYRGKIEFDQSKPDGTPRKLLNIEKLTTLGWQAKTPLEKGLYQTYQWYLDNQQEIRCA